MSSNPYATIPPAPSTASAGGGGGSVGVPSGAPSPSMHHAIHSQQQSQQLLQQHYGASRSNSSVPLFGRGAGAGAAAGSSPLLASTPPSTGVGPPTGAAPPHVAVGGAVSTKGIPNATAGVAGLAGAPATAATAATEPLPAAAGAFTSGGGDGGGDGGAGMLSGGGGSAADASTIDRIVLDYLRRRGFSAAEHALQKHVPPTAAAANPGNIDASLLALDQADLDEDLRNLLMLLRSPADLADSDVRRYDDSYCELRDWVDGSLDVYKPQLHAVLYPILVHCFLEMVRREHGRDAQTFLQRCAAEFTSGVMAEGATLRREELLALKSISSPQHVEENETARLFLTHRYEVHLSQYAFELLMSFLTDDPRRTVLLRIINQRCRMRFDTTADGMPLGAVGLCREGPNGKQKVVGLVADDERAGPPSGAVLWGRLRPELYMISDEAVEAKSAGAGGGLKGGKGKGIGEKVKGDGTGKKDSGVGGSGSGGGAGGGSGASAGVGAVGGAAGEEEEEAYVMEDGTLSKSQIPLKRYKVGAVGLDNPADVKSRANLRVADAVDGIRKDLAILFYTFINAREDGLNTCTVSEDGAQIVGGFGDSTVRVWDARAAGTAGGSGDVGGLEGRPLKLVGHSAPVYSVDSTKCARFVVSGSGDGDVRLWSVHHRTDVVAYKGHNFPVWSVGFSPLDHYFASGSHDRTGRVWSTDRVFPLRVFAGHLADVDVVRWHPNCNYVATGSSDRTARLWDLRDGSCVRVMHGAGAVYALAFSPDGTTLACGGDGRSIDVWDLRVGKRMRELRAHSSTVWSMDYSRDGAVLASGGEDRVVAIWRAEDWCSPVGGGGSGGNGGGEAGAEEGGAVGDGSGGASASGSGGTGEGNGGVVVDGGGDVVMDAGRDHGSAAVGGMGEGKREKRSDGGGGGGVVGVGRGRRAVPLVEKFETKQTPVQLVKFTRRNVLIAGGCFAAS